MKDALLIRRLREHFTLSESIVSDEDLLRVTGNTLGGFAVRFSILIDEMIEPVTGLTGWILRKVTRS